MSEVEVFMAHRSFLFGLAYRMLGSVMDAEDIVQEAFLRWQQVASATVETPRSYLTTVVTRLCIDHLRSARVRREQYVGPWLPELLVGVQQEDSAGNDALAKSLSLAFLVLLESLTPVERGVFLLHDIFDYSFEETAAAVGKSAANCRQIARLRLAHRLRPVARAEAGRDAHQTGRGRLLRRQPILLAGRARRPGLRGRGDASGRAGGRDNLRGAATALFGPGDRGTDRGHRGGELLQPAERSAGGGGARLLCPVRPRWRAASAVSMTTSSPL